MNQEMTGYVFLQTALCYWVYQLLHEVSFQIINIYSVSNCNQKRVSELL
jgi:hypothetical protein